MQKLTLPIAVLLVTPIISQQSYRIVDNDIVEGRGFRISQLKTIDWDDFANKPLRKPQVTLHVSKHHFPAGSAARKEIDKAVTMFNNTSGSTVRITVAGTDHKSKADLFDNNTSRNYFSYLDNTASGSFPCHNDGSTACSDDDDKGIDGWVMNACKYNRTYGWNSLGRKADHFVISVNTHCKDHASDITASDYPKADNIAHELAHAFGMGHADSWDSHQDFLSTMQGNMPTLSSFDKYYLRDIYPEETNTKKVELVVPNAIRVEYNNDIGYKNFYFNDDEGTSRKANPKELYLKDRYFWDCETNRSPVFWASYFNSGNKKIQSDKEVWSEIRLGKGTSKVNSSGNVVLSSQYHKGLEKGAQITWSQGVKVPQRSLSDLPFNRTLKLYFMVDTKNTFSEKSEDNNSINADLILRNTKADCSV